MSDTLTENAEVAGYLGAIRDALIDLEPSDRDDLLEDLEAHLYEVLAESGGASLELSLGAPAAYADELRASAGLEPGPVVTGSAVARLQRMVAKSSLWPMLAEISRQPWAIAVRGFVPTLRPGWWVLRGWLALFALLVWLHGGELFPYTSRVIVPTYHGNWLLGVVTVVVAVVLSVWLGRRTAALPDWARRCVLLGDAVVLVYVGSLYGAMENVARGFGVYPPPPYYGGVATTAPYHGITIDGRHPLNIFPYDAQGHLLTGVRLFDDRGRPVEGLGQNTSGGQVLVRVLPSDAAGGIVHNQYPQVAGAVNLNDLGLDPDGNPNKPPTAGPSAEAAYGRATPMPTPTVFVPPMAGATSSAVPATTLTPSAQPTGTKTSAAASKATTRAAVPTRSGVSGSTLHTP